MSSGRLLNGLVVVGFALVAGAVLAKTASSVKASAKPPAFKTVKANKKQIAAANTVLKASADCAEAAVEPDHAPLELDGQQRQNQG